MILYNFHPVERKAFKFLPISLQRMSTRFRVLGLYRRILRSANRDWPDPKHQEWIRQETKEQFRKYQGLVDKKHVEELIEETERHINVALHYGIPYSRPHHAQ